MTMKRTISGRNGKGSLAHNRRAFETENVDKTRVHLNIKYCDENLKAVYHELFDSAVERYNVGKSQITMRRYVKVSRKSCFMR